MKTLSLRERRLIALAVLLLLLCFLLFGIITPIIDGFKSRSNARDEYYSQMARNDRSIGNLPIWRRQVNDQKNTATRYTILAPTRSAAVDMFRENMLQFFVKSGTVVRSTQEIPSSDSWLKLRIDSQMSLTQIVDCLKRLHMSQKIIVVDAITISADRAFTNGRLSLMDVRFEISAPYTSPKTR